MGTHASGGGRCTFRSTGSSERSEQGGFSAEVKGASRSAGQKLEDVGLGRKSVLGGGNSISDKRDQAHSRNGEPPAGLEPSKWRGAEGPWVRAQAAPPHLGACACSLPSAGDAFLSLHLFQPQVLVLWIWAPGVHLPLLGKALRGRDWLGPAWSQGQRCGRGWGQACPCGWGVPPCLACLCAGSHCRIAVGRDTPRSGKSLRPGELDPREAALTPSDPVEVETAFRPSANSGIKMLCGEVGQLPVWGKTQGQG